MYHSTDYDYYLLFQGGEKREDINSFSLTSISDNFNRTCEISPEDIINKTIPELIEEYGRGFLGMEEVYNYLSFGELGKFEIYLDSLSRWYMVNIFKNKDRILLIYTDISMLKDTKDVWDEGFQASCDIDGLTGLCTRDYFISELANIDQESELPISVILGDLNGLKMINDAFGHYMGDDAIRSASEILKKVFQSRGLVSRLGGDEFTIILPGTSNSEAKKMIDQAKAKFEANPLESVELSMSFGLRTKVKKEEKIRDVIIRAEEEMYFNKLREGRQAKKELLEHIKKKMEAATHEDQDHYDRLKELARLFGKELGLFPKVQEELELLCEYHDIGLIGVPQKVYNKKGKFDEEDWYSMKRHSEIGYHILRSITLDAPIADHVLMHHERWDGQGYPRSLKGEEIDLVVRIFSILDAFDAMTHPKPYKKKMSLEESLEEIRLSAGSHFDPALAQRFIDMMTRN